LPTSILTIAPTSRTEVLIVDSESPSKYTPLFNANEYHVSTTAYAPAALEYIRRTTPALVVTDVMLDGGSGIDICSAAKALTQPATVLVTANNPELVPDAISAGCDSVLLKPFAPNLLISRASRLLRDRSIHLRLQAARGLGKSAHLAERADLLKNGTNRTWPSTQCPYCGHAGVTSFDFASMRRAWYACLECRKVWLAKRQE
jgi:DNA-binding response OmpR family regulator